MGKERYSIVFNSPTGNTKKLADTIYAVLAKENCDYFGVPKEGDLYSEMLYIGFWTDKGNADKSTLTLLSTLKNKRYFYLERRALAAARHISRRFSIMSSSLSIQAIPWSENICVRAKCCRLYGNAT